MAKKLVSSRLAGRVSHKNLTRWEYMQEIFLTWSLIAHRIVVYLTYGAVLRWTYRRAIRKGGTYHVDRSVRANLKLQGGSGAR